MRLKKHRRNDWNLQIPAGNYHSDNYFRKEKWMLNPVAEILMRNRMAT